jgi:CheY-like chemotaxis protein/anti-sigma regulatory factor (Ser/Thr protein kinase)
MTSILVVDDSGVDRSLVGGLLRKNPELAVDYAVNGAEALRKIEQAQPDLVISDLIMPELDGLELVAAVRSRHPLVPVILMTSKGSEEIAVQALQAGASSYVPKRRLSLQLLSTVENVLGASAAQRGHSRLMGCIQRSRFTFVLGNDCTLFRPLIAYLQESAGHLGLGDPVERTRLGVALEEALANALYHGNLEVCSALRDEDDRAYFNQIDARRREGPFCDRRIFVEAELSRDEARFVVRDEGTGFDPTLLPDPTDPANLEKSSGRGILLMRTFMDEVTFNAVGNEVRMLKRRK